MSLRWYAVVDAAADDALWPMLQRCEARTCLISGDIHPVLASAAPYLVALDDHEPLLEAWQQHGAGRHWGILCESDLPLAELRKQLRRFFQAKLPDGTIAQFRFYDPRVFATYLPSAPPGQQAQWFAGVRQFAVEGDGGRQHSFRWRAGRLFDGDTPVG